LNVTNSHETAAAAMEWRKNGRCGKVPFERREKIFSLFPPLLLLQQCANEFLLLRGQLLTKTKFTFI